MGEGHPIIEMPSYVERDFEGCELKDLIRELWEKKTGEERMKLILWDLILVLDDELLKKNKTEAIGRIKEAVEETKRIIGMK